MFTYKQTYRSDTSSLSIIRNDIKEFLLSTNLDIYCIEEIVIAANEACANIIQHANNGNYKGQIELLINADEQSIGIELHDEAEYADISSLRLNRDDISKPGGLGLYFIEQIMDQLVLTDNKSQLGNTISMTKKLK